MAEGEARVRLRVVGRREVEREVQRTARGVTRETKKAEQERQRAERQAERERRREAQKSAREEKQRQRDKARNEALVQREIVRLVRDAERAKRRENERTNREAARNARARARAEAIAARDRARAEQRAAREAERGQARAARDAAQRRGAILTTVGAVGVGLGAAGISASQRAQGVLGIPTKDEALRSFIGFRQQLLQTGSEAGLSDSDMERLQAEILQVSRGTNIDPSQLLTGLQTAQGRFDRLQDFRENLGAIARVAKASGAGLDEVIGAAGEAQRAFGLTSAELEEFLNVAFIGARRGSIEFSSIANDFSNVFGGAAAALGRGGIEGARETLALAQVLGTSGSAPSEVATMTERTMETLLDRDVQRRFSRAGINVAEENGRLRPLSDIARQLAANPALSDPRKLQELVGGRIEARRGIRVLRQRAIDSPEMFGSLQGISATEGAGAVTETISRMLSDPSGRAEAMGIERLASVFEDGGRLTETMEGLAGPLTELENEFPLLTSAVEELRPAIYALIGAMAFNRIAGGAGGAGSLLARGAGTVAAGAGGTGAATAAGGAGLATGAAVAGGVAAVAGVGYHLYDSHQRLSAMEAVREQQIADVERRIAGAQTPAELQAAFDADPRTNPGGAPQRGGAGGDLSQLPFFQQRVPEVRLSEEDRRLLRAQGIEPIDSRRGPGGPARRTP